MKARITVTLKSGILDPQGKAIEGALRSLGVQGVASVRQGKVFDIELEGADPRSAEALLWRPFSPATPLRSVGWEVRRRPAPRARSGARSNGRSRSTSGGSGGPST